MTWTAIEPDDARGTQAFVRFATEIDEAREAMEASISETLCLFETDSHAEAETFRNWPWESRFNILVVRGDNEWFVLGTCMKKGPKETKPLDIEDEPQEIREVCDLMAERVLANEYPVPNQYSKAWIMGARDILKRAKKLDKDIKSVKALIIWSTEDNFWRQNVRSPSGFAKHYDQLRLAANKEAKTKIKEQTGFSSNDMWNDASGN